MQGTLDYPISLTQDFSRIPSIGRGSLQFVGGTQFTVKGFFLGARLSIKMTNALKRTPGYVTHKVWYKFPLTIGSFVLFEDLAALTAFTRSKEHKELAAWSLRPGNVRAGFVRIYRADDTGTTMGGWVNQSNEGVDKRSLLGHLRRAEQAAPREGDSHAA
ncbi:MAG: hypothetical protein H0V07_01945 [Propionibacteriales bacterium]|nr:hypothetical protein [Propionibacteriales bacterium]